MGEAATENASPSSSIVSDLLYILPSGIVMHEKEWFILPGMKNAFLRFFSIARDYLSHKPAINNTPILIIGDSGVGKSLFIETAKQIFAQNNNLKLDESGSCDKVKRLNCASFSKELAESEIFGHVKGAYTGATSDKAGIVEIAKNGLLILDEIGELPDEVQAKLLIFIEDGEYRRLGSPEIRRASLKIIGTTNKRGGFRTDFWFRFYPIFLPAFYERRLDVVYYIALRYPDIFKRLTPQHILSLMAHHWPGNVREIERVISIMLSEDNFQVIQNKKEANKGTEKLFFPVDQRQTSLANMYLSDFCKMLIEHNFNISLFNRIISEYGLQVPYSYATFDDFFKIKVSFIKNGAPFTLNIDQESGNSLKDLENAFSDFFGSSSKGKNVSCENSDYNNLVENLESTSDSSTINTLLADIQDFLNTDIIFYSSYMFNKNELVKQVEGLSQVYFVENDNKLETIGSCFSAICSIFLKNRSSDENVFDMSDIYTGDYWMPDKVQDKILNIFNKHGLLKAALQLRLGSTAIIKHRYTADEKWSEYIKKIFNDNNLFDSAQKNKEPDEFNFAQFTEEQLLIAYYKFLLKIYRKDVDVFKHAGLADSTCRHELERLGLLPRKRKIDNS